jgi:hypothetical protein
MRTVPIHVEVEARPSIRGPWMASSIRADDAAMHRTRSELFEADSEGDGVRAMVMELIKVCAQLCAAFGILTLLLILMARVM